MERNGLQRQENPIEAGFAQPSGKDTALNEMASSVMTPSLDRKDFSAQAKPEITGQSSSGRKRKRDDAERVRVTRACDRCKAKKIRCTGTCPCPSCLKVEEPCDFKAEYKRGRIPIVQTGFGPTPETPTSATSQSYHEVRSQPAMLSPVSNDQGTMHLGAAPTSGQSPRIHSSRNSPEASQTDRQGHYVGPSSGVSFMLRVQRKLHEKASYSYSQDSSIFTFGDAPLPEVDPSLFIMPTRQDAKELLGRYFDFAVPTHRFLHRPTVEVWLEEFYETKGTMKDKRFAPSRTALLFMTFAQAREYTDDHGHDPSFRYFHAAEKQLSTEKGEIRLTSVQARLCQCFYLLAKSRLNHCWSLFGTTAHLVLAMGLHRRRRVEQKTDLIDHECRKRVLWCAYSLDKYLSSALGRPRTFHDEDIDQELPTSVNDSDLHTHHLTPNSSRAQSIMLAPIAHIKLLRIVSSILRDMYGITTPSRVDHINLAIKYSSALHDWRSDLNKFLDVEFIDTSLLIPLFQRQRNVLNFAYWHALLLVHRPFLLSNFASLTGPIRRQTNPREQYETDQNVGECLRAALSIAGLVDELVQGHQIYKAYWLTQYFAFSAVVVLYVYTIQQQQSSVDSHLAHYEAAMRCQAQISSLAVTDSLAERYGIVLEELRLEAVNHIQAKRTEHHQSQDVASRHHYDDPIRDRSSSGDIIQSAEQIPRRDSNMLYSGNQIGQMYNVSTPNSLVQEMTGWGQFDSMVTAGMSELGVFLTNEDDASAWNFPLLGGTTSV